MISSTWPAWANETIDIVKRTLRKKYSNNRKAYTKSNMDLVQ